MPSTNQKASQTTSRKASAIAASAGRRIPAIQDPKAVLQQPKAKVFMNGRSQAVRLPAAFRVKVDEVYVRKDDMTGDIVLSERPLKPDWNKILADLHAVPGIQEFAEDLIRNRDRSAPQERQWPWDE